MAAYKFSPSSSAHIQLIAWYLSV